MASAQPVLVAAAHGTRSAAGLATVAALVELVRAHRPGLDVRPAFVDVSEPFLTDVVAGIDGPLVVVPVLLSRGFHVRVDIPGALTGRDDAVATRPLGPDRAVSIALAQRLAGARNADAHNADARNPDARDADARDAAARRPDARDAAARKPDARDADVRNADTVAAPQIVLVATGSSDPDAAEDLAAAAADLAALQRTPVHATVMSGPGVPFADALARLGPSNVDVVPYLLAEGVFFDRLRDEAKSMGVRTVGDPLGAHPGLAELILARYAAATLVPTESGTPGR